MRSYKDVKLEYRAFLAKAHETKRHRMEACSVWLSQFKDSLRAPSGDEWKLLYELKHSYNNGKYVLYGKEIQNALRTHLVSLQKNRCCYCQGALPNTNHARHVEHVLPKVTYPQFSLQYRNLAVACFDCNQLKDTSKWSNIRTTSKVYPKSGHCLDYFHPRLHIYNNHIKLIKVQENSVAIAIYVGKTPQGKHLCANLLAARAKAESLVDNNKHLATYIRNLQEYASKQPSADQSKLDELITMLRNRAQRVAYKYG